MLTFLFVFFLWWHGKSVVGKASDIFLYRDYDPVMKYLLHFGNFDRKSICLTFKSCAHLVKTHFFGTKSRQGGQNLCCPSNSKSCGDLYLFPEEEGVVFNCLQTPPYAELKVGKIHLYSAAFENTHHLLQRFLYRQVQRSA